MHLAPKFFFAKKNLHALVIIYSKNFLDFVKSSIFYAPLKSENRTEIAAILAHDRVFKEQGSGNYCDVISRTRQSVFRASSHGLLVYVWKVSSILVANSRNMPNRCVVGGCSNERSSEKGIPFYGDERPEAKIRRKRWIDLVRFGWDPPIRSILCIVIRQVQENKSKSGQNPALYVLMILLHIFILIPFRVASCPKVVAHILFETLQTAMFLWKINRAVKTSDLYEVCYVA